MHFPLLRRFYFIIRRCIFKLYTNYSIYSNMKKNLNTNKWSDSLNTYEKCPCISKVTLVHQYTLTTNAGTIDFKKEKEPSLSLSVLKVPCTCFSENRIKQFFSDFIFGRIQMDSLCIYMILEKKYI